MNLTTKWLYDSGLYGSANGFVGTTTATGSLGLRATATAGAADNPAIGAKYQLIDNTTAPSNGSCFVDSSNKLHVPFSGVGFGGVFLPKNHGVSNPIVEITIAAGDADGGPSFAFHYDDASLSQQILSLQAYGSAVAPTYSGGGGGISFDGGSTYSFATTHAHVCTASIVMVGNVANFSISDLDTTAGGDPTTFTFQQQQAELLTAGDQPLTWMRRGPSGVSQWGYGGTAVKISRLRIGEQINGDRLIICIGNSRTAGIGATATGIYSSWPGNDPYPVQSSPLSPTLPGQTFTLLGGTGYDVVNAGRSGWALQPAPGQCGLLALAGTDLVYPFDYSRTKKPICVLWSGTNAFSNGSTYQDEFARLLTYCQLARRQGYYAIPCMEILGNTGTGWATWMAGFNALVLANAGEFDAIARFDLAGYPGDGGTYGGLHPTNAGYGLLAPYLVTAILAVVASESGGVGPTFIGYFEA